MRLLDEMLEKYPMNRKLRVLDLGCGKGLTSLYLAKEFDARYYSQYRLLSLFCHRSLIF